MSIDFPTDPPINRHGDLPALLITVEEAARLLGIGRTKAYELVMSGEVQSIKLGRRRLMVRASLDSFIEKKVAEGAD